MEIIWLQRPHESIPWGFRLQGGREFGQPLAVQRVSNFCAIFKIQFLDIYFSWFGANE